ncbi:amidohydrolase [Amphritea balenae]|uniref:Amidohydrolase n=1 Tax=Amphritea balenae TaxID=452629 RepID=A0A3P1SNQ6_9GAMM|nr:amidohydrolase [Amphritea balenae]RRC98881.1 amidohydrolase [Amphritea balenae]GGK62515.1 amidohydrolase [Amphritea balenae]
MVKAAVSVTTLLLILFLMAFLSGYTASPQHRVFINGSVLTMDENNAVVEAVSIRDGVIEAVGSNQDIQQLIMTDTQVTDLQGKALLPGFIDAHSHFPVAGFNAISADLSPPPVGSTGSMDLLLEQIRLKTESTAAGEWILGFGYDDSSLKEQRHPERRELDKIAPNHPVYLWHSSGHMGVANSVALEKIGIDEAAVNPPGGVLGRDLISGRLNGLLQEQAALTLNDLISEFSVIDYYRIFDKATNEYVSQGITTAQSGGISLPLARALYWAAELRQLPFRLVVLPQDRGFGQQLLAGSLKVEEFNSGRFHIGPVKIVADGSVQGRTAFLTEPFYQNPDDKPGYRGFPAISQADLTSKIGAYHRAGFQLAIHGNGDAGIDNIIQAFSAAQKGFPVTDPRMILVHAQMARDDQLQAMRQLGITPSFFPTHTYFWGDQHLSQFMGPERGPNMSPTGSALDMGLKFSVHTDAPVTPIDPLGLLWSTVNRRSVTGQLIGGEQRISVMQALRAITIDAAWQVFQENNRGSIEPGKLADLVILSGNPLLAPGDIRQLSVEETIVGGVTVYSAP